MDHITAKRITDSVLGDLSAAERLYLRAVASMESYYGDAGTWRGSNNWGALTGKGDAGSIQHADTRPSKDGSTSYTTAFRKYSSPERGARGLVSTLMKPVTKLAIAAGSIPEAAASQYGYAYYSGHDKDNRAANIAAYANALAGTVANIVAQTGERNPFDIAGISNAGALNAWNSLTGRSDNYGSIIPGLFRSSPAAVTQAMQNAGRPTAPKAPSSVAVRRFALLEYTKSPPTTAPGQFVHQVATFHPDTGWSPWTTP